ncbi:MAG: hypothetical protein COZ46_07035 [Verrucomicrobia bacterium CG_4_10_14_3_um_filter_43_23]|nr:MAG: hypothetical protein AUJ82_04945 [Verrucomicrobia bacterium CG1_02_43_26]PIP59842.1 MAG: hypothetical protein COX01_01640 [Verrucomicrobia bacterium CG22_combo_CG10-13_8_21_14_all_43_17]PIX57854.1 MAG: hypothetical protein COZ46_07035 [Verrucomicrobia bacterium CG_4_10_14_3_um_filter_43_23]PIY63059.1 MAG: hypothetical protein COY94_00580 [Verrucomicrobia bacterium CG_4_10_14_0_8_um_filter_43_34]
MEKIILQIPHNLLEKINCLSDSLDLSFNDYLIKKLEELPENNANNDLRTKKRKNNLHTTYE